MQQQQQAAASSTPQQQSLQQQQQQTQSNQLYAPQFMPQQPSYASYGTPSPPQSSIGFPAYGNAAGLMRAHAASQAQAQQMAQMAQMRSRAQYLSGIDYGYSPNPMGGPPLAATFNQQFAQVSGTTHTVLQHSSATTGVCRGGRLQVSTGLTSAVSVCFAVCAPAVGRDDRSPESRAPSPIAAARHPSEHAAHADESHRA